MNNEWYSVSGLFRWYFKSNNETYWYEKRMILVKANSFDQALDKAEEEALEYCQEDVNANFMIESLKKYRAYLIDEPLEDKIEIYSERKESELSPEEYIEKFYNENDS